MRVIIAGVVLVTICCAAASGQSPVPPNNRAPTDRAKDFKDAELRSVSDSLAARKLITERIIEGGTYSVNVRHIVSSETALVHGKISEVWVVRDGSGTVVTGGELVDPKGGAGAGDFSGSSVRGGIERQITAGDIVFIPPGVPHGIKETRSITYLNIRFETK